MGTVDAIPLLYVRLVYIHIGMTGTAAVGLFHNSVLIDIIGVYNEYFGISWSVAGVTGATSNHDMVRQPTVSQGTTDFYYPGGVNNNEVDTSQWIVTSYTSGTVSTFHSHSYTTTLSVFTCPSSKLTMHLPSSFLHHR
jgi:hypothetical protein